MITRRDFIDTLVFGAAGLAVTSSAKSYGQILGSNDRLNFAVIGLNGRAYAHLSSLSANRKTARVSHVVDVDANILKKYADSAEKELGYGPAMVRDFQNHLDFDDDKLENLDISPKQFQQIRSGILKGYKTARPVAMEVGSRLEFLDGTSPGCFQKPSFVMNRLSEDGDCILERCYPVDKLPALRNC